MRINRVILGGLLILSSATLAVAQVPVIGGKGARLKDIAGTDTLVTVVLKGSGAQDSNLKIDSVSDNVLNVVTQKGKPIPYLLSDVQEVRVQGSVMTVKHLDPLLDRGLTADQQQIVDRALERANEIFGTATGDQPLRMDAAEILAVGGNEDAKHAALEYLNGLASGNDIRTALEAARHLYLAGASVPSSDLVTQGLSNGDRQVKAAAALLAGLTKDPSGKEQLFKMLRDRAADIAVPAIEALAYLGDRDAIPTLLSLITERNEEKGHAAMNALIMLGGQDVIDALKLKLPAAEGMGRYRVVRVLQALGDPEGKKLLSTEMLNTPSLEFNTAVVLARQGNLEAAQVLRERLAQKYDALEEVLNHRAEATAALIESGDRANIGVFQELLRLGMPSVDETVLALIATLQAHSLLPVAQPAIESTDPTIAVAGCRAAEALANPNYAERLKRANAFNQL